MVSIKTYRVLLVSTTGGISSQLMDLDVPHSSSLTPYTFLESTKGECLHFHILATMAHNVASNLDHIVKFYIDLKGQLVAIEEECCKEVDVRDVAELAHCEANYKLKKVQEAHRVSQLVM